MGSVLSIDLASKFARDFGVCLLNKEGKKPIDISFPNPGEIGVVDPLEPQACAAGILSYCKDNDIYLIMLDGPQGWMDSTRVGATYRYCEELTQAPAKTGIVGQVKPRTYKGFVEFSIALFSHLVNMGVDLLTSRTDAGMRDGCLAVESFPLSAWKRLSLTPLPAKKRATQQVILEHFRSLEELFDFDVTPDLARKINHDQMQALVAGLAGVFLLAGEENGYVLEGIPAVIRDGTVMEGFIVNPRL